MCESNETTRITRLLLDLNMILNYFICRMGWGLGDFGRWAWIKPPLLERLFAQIIREAYWSFKLNLSYAYKYSRIGHRYIREPGSCDGSPAGRRIALADNWKSQTLPPQWTAELALLEDWFKEQTIKCQYDTKWIAEMDIFHKDAMRIST